jgi:hypothetical protein
MIVTRRVLIGSLSGLFAGLLANGSLSIGVDICALPGLLLCWAISFLKGSPHWSYRFSIGLWMLMLGNCVFYTAVGAAIGWLASLFSRRGEEPGPRCRKCSYNLTGNVSGIWPECGKSVTEGRAD